MKLMLKMRVLLFDLNNGLPQEVLNEKFDAVVSCFALHHLEYDKRVLLYTAIRHVLKNGSLFINGDMFKGDSPVMNERKFDNWVRWMVTKMKEHLGEEITFDDMKRRQLESFQKMGDKPGTIWDMHRDMTAAGFQHVDCMVKVQNLAVMVATKGI
jgi:tRNA (cmo5U34)-methyltransferase